MNSLDILSIHNFLTRKYKKTDGEETKNTDFYFYLLRAVPILDEYCTLRKQQEKLVFHSSNQVSSDELSIKRRKQLICDYMQLVSDYFSTDYKEHEWDKMEMTIQDQDKKEKDVDALRLRCPLCQITDANIMGQFSIYDNHYVCEKCGYVGSTTHNNISYKDIDRVNICSKYTYDRRTHFRDCINQFQGKQNASIDPKVYSDLLQQFLSHGLIPENYKDLPHDVAFKDVHKEHILLFLKETGHSKHYEDVVLIFHQLTQKPAPDISHLENDLLRDFDILADLYDKKYKSSERKNFINTQYVLYQLLRRHRYPCRKEDFNILKTIDRKYYHDTICQELFEILGWNFQALF